MALVAVLDEDGSDLRFKKRGIVCASGAGDKH
jgi:hypothetical protein